MSEEKKAMYLLAGLVGVALLGLIVSYFFDRPTPVLSFTSENGTVHYFKPDPNL